MRHSHTHILRMQERKWLLHLTLAFLLPAALLVFVLLYLNADISDLGWALFISLTRLAFAYCVSLVIAVLIAVLVGSSRDGGEHWMAVFDVAQNVPSFALIPVFAMAMGYSATMIIVFAVTSIIWPILFSVLSAIRTAHVSLNEAASIFGARGIKRVVYYLVPLSYPAIIAGSVVGVSIGWEAVIGGEIIGHLGGIGSFLNDASTAGETPLVVAGLSALLITVFIINRLVWAPLLRQTYEYRE